MIKLGGKALGQGRFPDGTPLLHFETTEGDMAEIVWLYRDMEEALNVMFVAGELRRRRPGIILRLTVPYFPNARMDRVEGDDDVFTLEHFAAFVNFLGFDEVNIADPHSDRTCELVERLNVMWPGKLVERAAGLVAEAEGCEPMLFYPDEGAMRRYSGMFERPFAYAEKQRDWDTGRITGLELVEGTEPVAGKAILIVDDICSKGGTFHYSAKELKEHGAGNVYLYVTHCEPAVSRGRLLGRGGLVEHIYTTNSIERPEYDKITVFKEW